MTVPPALGVGPPRLRDRPWVVFLSSLETPAWHRPQTPAASQSQSAGGLPVDAYQVVTARAAAAPDEYFSVDVSFSAKLARLHLHGELDVGSAPMLRAAVEQACLADKTIIVVDASDMSYCDSRGIAALVDASVRCSDEGRDMRLIGVRPAVRRGFEASDTEPGIHLVREPDQKVEQLRQALASRGTIGQAQGILMERERITAGQAFDILRTASQHLNIKLRDVAERLVDTGEDPRHWSATPDH